MSIAEHQVIDIKKISVPKQVLELVPAPMARLFGVLPLELTEDTLSAAVENIDDLDAFDRLENTTGFTINPIPVMDKNALAKAIQRCYPDSTLDGAPANAAVLFDIILNQALQLRASDIHIDPIKEGGVVKMRVDGRMRVERELEWGEANELISRIKVLADLDIAEKRTPLDGQITIHLGEDEVNLRVATIPTIYGEHITLRLLTQDSGEELEEISSLGMREEHLEMFNRAISCPNGIILLSGPTGSGKTTTLYAALRRLRTGGDHHLVSIEDPVEKPVDGVTQIKIDADGERVTFNKALRSVLRHDPDVVMVGEIRDGETGDIAVKAALTGHLVLSTLHTNSAAGVLVRLINLGIPPFLVASTLRLAIAQRLVRSPCSHCLEWEVADETSRLMFGWDPKDRKLKIPKAVGCSFCGDTGYSGRIALYEMIEVDREIRNLILHGADEAELGKCAFVDKQLTTLRADGGEKILQGLTTVDEVEAVTVEELQ